MVVFLGCAKMLNEAEVVKVPENAVFLGRHEHENNKSISTIRLKSKLRRIVSGIREAISWTNELNVTGAYKTHIIDCLELKVYL